MLSALFCFYLMLSIREQDVSGQKIDFSVSKEYTDHIFLYYYEGPTLDNYKKIKLEDGLSLTEQPGFDVNITTVFHFHGWRENATFGSAETIMPAFLKKKICNVVTLDYSLLVSSFGNVAEEVVNYAVSVKNATHIGQAFGEFFKLYIPEKQPTSLIRMVSFSLGAQIMGKTARVFGVGQLERLTALDPAGPFYNIPGIHHLNSKDGKFVDIIHSDGGFFGDGRTIGTVDFFPNKGTRVQPGCNENLANLTSYCSHSRAYEFYAESIEYPKNFLGKKCWRTILFNKCCCKNNDLTYMGYYSDISARGTYYLETNPDSPFGKGSSGVNF